MSFSFTQIGHDQLLLILLRLWMSTFSIYVMLMFGALGQSLTIGDAARSFYNSMSPTVVTVVTFKFNDYYYSSCTYDCSSLCGYNLQFTLYVCHSKFFFFVVVEMLFKVYCMQATPSFAMASILVIELMPAGTKCNFHGIDINCFLLFSQRLTNSFQLIKLITLV